MPAQFTFSILLVAMCGGLASAQDAPAEKPAEAEKPAADAKASKWQITVATTRNGTSGDLMTIDLDGRNPEQLTEDEKGAVEPGWSPDGKRLAFVSFRKGYGQIFAMNADGGNLQNLSDNSSKERNPAWSPDGKKLAFTSNRDGRENVWVMNSDGRQAVNLTAAQGSGCDPSWSPDGKSILYASKSTGRYRVFLVGTKQPEPKDLLGEDQFGALYPSYSPNGKQMVCGLLVDQRSVQVHLMSAEGRDRQALTPPTDSDKPQHAYAAWSPDGRYLAYVGFRRWPHDDDMSVDPQDKPPPGDLWIYDLAADKHTKLLSNEMSMWGPKPSWKPIPKRGK